MSTDALRGRIRAAMGQPAPAPEVPDTRDASAELTEREQVDYLMRWSGDFQEALPACVELSAFEAAIRDLVPTLNRCRTSTVLQALLACARFGLVPDGRQATIIADQGRAVFVPMYQGYIDLMHRSGHVESVRAGFIYEGEEWSHEPSAPPPLDFTHKSRPDLGRAERGEPVLAYAFAWLRGGARSQVVLISAEDAEEVRDNHSRAYQRAEETGSRDSAWHTNFAGMWRKTPIRRLSSLVPMSAEVRALVAVEDAGEAGRVQVLLAPEPETAPEGEGGGEALPDLGGPSQRQRAVEAARRRLARSRGKKQRGGPKGAAA